MLGPGTEIGGYKIERLLGRGGMGEVYEAVQMGLGRPVALKVLNAGLIGDEEFRDRFRREGRLQATLEHPNVVTVYEAGESAEGLFLAMRLIDGPTLKQLIGAGGLDPERTMTLLTPIADALDTAHESGLVHRDVKPQNILVGAAGTPYLADFGLTRGAGATGLTRSGLIVGTADYISPEQVKGEPAGPASDVYAFTAVLYECLTGTVPYDLDSGAAVLYAHVHDDPPSLEGQGLPAGVGEAIAAGMAKDPARRAESCGEVIGLAGVALGQTPARGARRAGGSTAIAAAPAEAATGPGPGSRRGGTAPTKALRPLAPLTAVVGVGVLAAVAAAALLIGHGAGASSPPGLDTVVAGPTVAFHAPGDWEPTVGDSDAPPGMELQGAVSAGPAAEPLTGVTAGTTDATGRLLLPAGFVGRVEGGLPTPDPVDLGELEALRYRGLRLRGSPQELTVYAAPATSGVATLVCASPAAGSGPEEACEAVARTLVLSRGKPLPLAPSAATEHRLAAVVTALNVARRHGRRRLHQAGDPKEQEAATGALAGYFAAAAKRLGRIDPGLVAAGRVEAARGAAAATARAYHDLSTAAGKGDRVGYREAAGQVEAGEKRLDAALASLG
jgi:serine/threonine-protein kinase